MDSTKNPVMTKTGLNKILWLSQQDKELRFNNLMSLFNEELLRGCFNKLDGKKAVGIDRVRKEDYALNVEENIRNLIGRMKTMTYRPGPVREVLIPKEGKPGATRPLGISNFEDKIVQAMVQQVLESIYEPLFYGCSYGFRPGRGCHNPKNGRSTLYGLFSSEQRQTQDPMLVSRESRLLYFPPRWNPSCAINAMGSRQMFFPWSE